jgi:hypothetical protein
VSPQSYLLLVQTERTLNLIQLPHSQTYKVDRDAAVAFIHAAASIPSITRFLLVSYNGSRRAAAPWWDAAEWEDYNKKINYGALADYHQAKLAADEAFYEICTKSPTLTGINLRPGMLQDGPAGKVTIGKTDSVNGHAKREAVAQVAAALLAHGGVKTGYYDMLDGNDTVDDAVNKVVRDGVDTAEGEPVKALA